MSEYQICRLTPSLVASWQKDLHPDLRWALGHQVCREDAEEIRQTLEAQGVPERWKFAKKWFSKKHGAIFMLKELVERKKPGCSCLPELQDHQSRSETTLSSTY